MPGARRIVLIEGDFYVAISHDRLVELITQEVQSALFDQGIITQADIDAREERLREVARIGGRDMIRIVS